MAVMAEAGIPIADAAPKHLQQFLGQPCPEAVISVPAYYNDHQRQAVKEAGRLAGFGFHSEMAAFQGRGIKPADLVALPLAEPNITIRIDCQSVWIPESGI